MRLLEIEGEYTNYYEGSTSPSDCAWMLPCEIDLTKNGQPNIKYHKHLSIVIKHEDIRTMVEFEINKFLVHT